MGIDIPPKDELDKLHNIQKLSQGDIAKKFNVSRRTVGRWLEKYGIKARTAEQGLQTKNNPTASQTTQSTSTASPPPIKPSVAMPSINYLHKSLSIPKPANTSTPKVSPDTVLLKSILDTSIQSLAVNKSINQNLKNLENRLRGYARFFAGKKGATLNTSSVTGTSIFVKMNNNLMIIKRSLLKMVVGSNLIFDHFAGVLEDLQKGQDKLRRNRRGLGFGFGRRNGNSMLGFEGFKRRSIVGGIIGATVGNGLVGKVARGTSMLLLIPILVGAIKEVFVKLRTIEPFKTIMDMMGKINSFMQDVANKLGLGGQYDFIKKATPVVAAAGILRAITHPIKTAKSIIKGGFSLTKGAVKTSSKLFGKLGVGLAKAVEGVGGKVATGVATEAAENGAKGAVGRFLAKKLGAAAIGGPLAVAAQTAIDVLDPTDTSDSDTISGLMKRLTGIDSTKLTGSDQQLYKDYTSKIMGAAQQGQDIEPLVDEFISKLGFNPATYWKDFKKLNPMVNVNEAHTPEERKIWQNVAENPVDPSRGENPRQIFDNRIKELRGKTFFKRPELNNIKPASTNENMVPGNVIKGVAIQRSLIRGQTLTNLSRPVLYAQGGPMIVNKGGDSVINSSASKVTNNNMVIAAKLSARDARGFDHSPQTSSKVTGFYV